MTKILAIAGLAFIAFCAIQIAHIRAQYARAYAERNALICALDAGTVEQVESCYKAQGLTFSPLEQELADNAKNSQ